MKPVKNRLGRGLGALIAGGTPPPVEPVAAAPVPKPALKGDSAKAQLKALEKKAPVKTKPAVQKVQAPNPAAKPKPLASKPKGAVPSAAKAEKTATPIVEAVADALPEYRELALGVIDTNPHQPRQHMDPEKLDQLVASIRSEGLLQPVVVREVGGRYELIAGERRLQACQMLGMQRIPARVLNVTDASSATLALIENLQREGLNPIEEASGFKSLMEDFDLTQEAVAERLGKSRPAIANALRFLQLPKEVQGHLAKGWISPGHAKVILSLQDVALQLLMSRRIIEEQLSVRQAEKAVEALQKGQSLTRATPIHEPHLQSLALQDLEKRIGLFLGAKVLMKHTANKGRIVIEYKGESQLQNILELTGLAKVSQEA
jgi:ParB family chromosome partitioning protein